MIPPYRGTNMSSKQRVQITTQQKLEYAKVMVEDGYSSQQIQEINGAYSSAVVRWKRQCKEEMLSITPTNKTALTPEQQRIQDLEKQLARLSGLRIRSRDKRGGWVFIITLT
ncbi:hypothetical protein GCM10007931_23020 [Vibrio algivorus]|uniref:Transposase n=1 Tax=Vibrio algivorus TaxID=1667024 RepID=A0ABQ6ERY0_9VIBR|nr:hypothetical protein GCM10007931_23020 [Vibrio algivorus]